MQNILRKNTEQYAKNREQIKYIIEYRKILKIQKKNIYKHREKKVQIENRENRGKKKE